MSESHAFIVRITELLGLQESVELLSGVAELDSEQVPPAMLEIAQRKSVILSSSMSDHAYLYSDVGFVLFSLWPLA